MNNNSADFVEVHLMAVWSCHVFFSFTAADFRLLQPSPVAKITTADSKTLNLTHVTRKLYQEDMQILAHNCCENQSTPQAEVKS